ncbi:hypothetical protein D9C01_13635, partial [Corynebacterium diphtheriae]
PLTGYDRAPYLVLATRNGLVKKTPLLDYDTNRTRPARGQPARVPAGRADRADPAAHRLRPRPVPRARHPQRPREEDPAAGLRHEPH